MLKKSLLLLFLAVLKAYGAFGFNLDGSLDKDAISHAYYEGEFSKTRLALEVFRQNYRYQTRDDSIFVYKYLSVIYAADPSMHPKAESYMVQLLKLMPTIEIVDLYVSDEIDAQFHKVKENYFKQLHYIQGHDVYGRAIVRVDSAASLDTAGIHSSGPKKNPSVRTSSWNRPAVWIIGGVAVASSGIAAYFLFKGKDAPPEILVPKQ